ncbi:MAG TPA: DNA recombination protein RmuC [Moraxellaceae bacterium]|nr:DNA recombination protein RmuC [Moraxellaceae bacterium]
MSAISGLLLAVVLGALAGALAVFLWRQARITALQLEQQRLLDAAQANAVTTAREQMRAQQLEQELLALAALKSLPATLAAAEARLVAQQEQEKQLLVRLQQGDEERRRLELTLRERDARLAELDTRLQAEREQLESRMAFVKEQEQTLRLQFEQLATRIFEEKSQKFTEQNRTGLDTLLSPLREQLKDFREKVETTYGNEARERFALKEQLTRLEGLNRQISDDASNLTKALKGDKKLQGNWGEVILSRVLEESGLREGHEYVTQFSVTDEEGQRRLPDVIVRLPENRDIVIDAKVSLVDYERYCSSEDENERERALKAHTGALRNHIRLLSEKRYEDLPGLRTLDFVFLFMPVESAFMLAVEHDPALFREAFDKKIIIVSPTTLLATLRTVESIWRYERQNRNAEQIAKEAGLLHDKFAMLLDHLDGLGKALDRSQEQFRKTVSSLSGHGGLVGRVEKLKKLGAKAKKALPLEKLDLDSGSDTTDDEVEVSVDTGEDAES